MAETVLVVEDNALVRKLITDAVQGAGYTVVATAEPLAALDLVRTHHLELALIDLTLPQIDGIELVRRLRQQREMAGLLIVILTMRDRLEDKLEAFQAGADEYLVKPIDTRELVARIGALLARARVLRSEGKSREGRLLAFFSAKGGVGTTTVCVNTAAALARLSTDPILVADLVLPLGSVGAFVGVDGATSIVELLGDDQHEVTTTRLPDHLFTRDRLGFQVLLGAGNPDKAQRVSPGQIEPFLRAMRQVAGYSLVDVGRSLSRISLPVLTSAERVIVVVSGDQLTLTLTRTCLRYFAAAGIPLKRVVILMNSAVGGHGASKRDAESVLEAPIFGVIPHDGDRFTAAVAQGVPIVQKEPESGAALQFMDLARQLLKAVA